MNIHSTDLNTMSATKIRETYIIHVELKYGQMHLLGNILCAHKHRNISDYSVYGIVKL